MEKKNDSILVKTNENLNQDRLMLFVASKTAPQCKFLATRLVDDGSPPLPEFFKRGCITHGDAELGLAYSLRALT